MKKPTVRMKNVVCFWFQFRLLVLTIDDLKDLGIQSLGYRLEILVSLNTLPRINWSCIKHKIMQHFAS